jgi:hypothetical protein
MPIVRTVVRSLIAGVFAVAVAGVAGSALAAPVALAGPAASMQSQHQQSARTIGAVASGLAVSIDSVSPQFATANSTITVRGTITNHTGGPLESVQVQLQTSPVYFTSRSEMNNFSNGEYVPDVPLNAVIGTPWYEPVSATLHSGATMSWTASFPVASQGYTRPYEVYPIEAQALSASFTPLGDARTFLPYWRASGVGAPDKLDISWVWPLIDAPQQGACSNPSASGSGDLATNKLASSLAAGGRLNGLLAAGLEYANSTSLTWAVDPALLSDATVMTQRYKVGGDARCIGTTGMPASSAAATWLNDLRTGIRAGEQTFVTPYADPDVSALVHAGLDADLVQSYALGDSEAQQVLGPRFGSGPAIAWPANGVADAGVLTSLASDGQVGTTVLNSSEMPALPTPTNPYPPDDAVTSVPNGIGTTMNVLLADSGISAELGSATAGSSASTQFSVEQDFLAQTAMIAAEAPNSQRSVVIAPPRRWDPSEGEAAALLRLTESAPWLRSVPLSSLASLGGKHATTVARKQLPGSKVAPRELSADYMSTVQSVRRSAGLYYSMLYKPPAETKRSLAAAVAATESSAWRGRASPGGWTAIRTLSGYLSYREKQVQIISGNTVVLAGPSGTTPVSVSNGLDVPVLVEVHASPPAGSQLTIGNSTSVPIPAQQTTIVRLPVRSAALGSTLVQLQLATKNGTPLGPTQSLSIESTRFGRALLIVIGAALGVLVLLSLARWLRRAWREGISEADGR